MTRRTWLTYSAAVHAWVLVAVGAYLTVILLQPEPRAPDANIGAGFGMLAFAALGLPWSLLGLSGTLSFPRERDEIVLYVGCALLNLALHVTLAAVALRADQRLSRAAGDPPSTA